MFGQVEVEDFYLVIFTNHHIRRFQITVDNSVVVGRLKGIRNLAGNLQGIGQRQRSSGKLQSQIFIGQQFHGEEVYVICGMKTVDGGDVRVVE